MMISAGVRNELKPLSRRRHQAKRAGVKRLLSRSIGVMAKRKPAVKMKAAYQAKTVRIRRHQNRAGAGRKMPGVKKRGAMGGG